MQNTADKIERLNLLSGQILDAAIEVHRVLGGPGLHPLFIDLFVDREIIIEVKSVEKLNPIYNVQLLTYLRLTNKPLGLIINFGEKFVKNGFHRIVNNFP